MREPRPRFDTNSPMLMFKIGILGVAPLDFPETLAERMSASYLSSDRIRKELAAADTAASTGRSVDLNVIRRTIMSRAVPLLRNGQDVVLDMFFNTPKSRRFPLEVAERAGSLSVALDIHAPFQTALDRVRAWTDQDAFEIPVAEWDVTPLTAARGMTKHIQRPHDEGLDYVLRLDGTAGDMEAMIHQTYEHLDKHGLVE